MYELLGREVYEFPCLVAGISTDRGVTSPRSTTYPGRAATGRGVLPRKTCTEWLYGVRLGATGRSGVTGCPASITVPVLSRGAGIVFTGGKCRLTAITGGALPPPSMGRGLCGREGRTG